MTDESKTPVKDDAQATTVVAEPSNDKGGDKRAVADNQDRPKRGRRDDNRAPREPKEFEESILQIDRVTRVNSGGRTMRFRVSLVIGDKKGRVGFGIGKSGEVVTAIKKAVALAKKNLVTVPVYNDTIPHETNTTFKSSRVLLMPAPAGKGVIAGGAVRKILELSGVKNVLSKTHGSRNRINVAEATMMALQSLQKRSDAPKEASTEEKKEKKAPVKEAPAKAEKKEAAKKPAAKKKPTAKKAAPKK